MDPGWKEVNMYIKVDELIAALKKNLFIWHISGQAIELIIDRLPKYDLKQPKEKKVKK